MYFTFCTIIAMFFFPLHCSLAEILLAFHGEAYLFSLTENTWKDGPKLPKDLYSLTSVQLDNGFMVLGARDPASSSESTDDIYSIDNSYAAKSWIYSQSSVDFDEWIAK